eukprot:946911-Rhodomonas_salina.6
MLTPSGDPSRNMVAKTEDLRRRCKRDRTPTGEHSRGCGPTNTKCGRARARPQACRCNHSTEYR